jgi:hypothetical protein
MTKQTPSPLITSDQGEDLPGASPRAQPLFVLLPVGSDEEPLLGAPPVAPPVPADPPVAAAPLALVAPLAPLAPATPASGGVVNVQ